ncbi:MAG TPA: M56 family metallopeptidase, partial [Verrucomicrobiales bacterium]|nr:M56 family metallopeptidase [Verrucomicrobiales bacterium]
MTASPDFNLWLTQNAAPLFVDVAVKSVLLLALAWGAVFCMKGSSAAARHLVWFLAVAGLLALPLLSGSLPGWRVLPRWMDWTRAEPAPAVAAVAAADPARQASITPLPANIPGPVAIAPSFAAGWHESLSAATPSIRVPERTPGRAFDLWRVGLILWISVGALALLPVVLGTFGLWRLERTARVEKGSAWLELLKRLLNRLRIRRSVVLLKSAQRRMPMTWGVLRPRLLLPEESREWTEDRRRVVMLHELAHARRWDYLTNLTTQFACALYWFNPLVWIAARQMIAERERACDDIVLHHGAKPAHYAEQVL